MRPLTYERYLANSAVREEMEREARRERAEAVYRFFVAPVIALFKRAAVKPAPRLQPRSA